MGFLWEVNSIQIEFVSKKSSVLLWIVAIVFLVALSSIIAWNAIGLRQAVEQRTQSYLSDVSTESAQLVESQLKNAFQSLHLLVDGAPALSDEEWMDFLHSKKEACGFAELALVTADGTARLLNGEIYNISTLPAFQTALAGEDSIAAVEDSIVYLVPLAASTSSARILLGVASIDQLRSLISIRSFNGEGGTSIIDPNGQLVMAPLQKKFNSWINETEYVVTEDWAQEILRNLRDQRSGTLTLPTKSGEDIFIDYRPLSVNGWSIATMVPKNFMSSDLDSFVSSTFYLILVLVALFLLLLLAIIGLQNRYRYQIEKLSFTDPVTNGISNICFLVKTQEYITKNPQNPYAVVSLNIRNFSLINDFEGRNRGDQLLRRVYDLLAAETHAAGEWAARGEADTYYLFLQYAPKDQLQQRLERIAEKLLPLGGSVGPLRVDFGIFISSSSSTDMGSAEEYADIARKHAERSYRSTYTEYSEELKLRQHEDAAMLIEIEKALEQGQLQIYLQPKVWAATGKAAGAEALVRWEHPEKGMISPASFIPLCEKNGLICQLDLFVFNEVCKCLDAWRREGYSLLPVSVNLSRQHFKDKHFLDQYKAVLDRWRIDPQWIELELTESIMLANDEFGFVQNFIEELHAIGFTCSLDDFGSGYSSLGLLKELSIDALKLDRQFFASQFEKPNTKLVIDSIIQLAKKLGITTVAEGVEQEEQAAFLRAAGCDIIQGYLYSPPLPVAKFEQQVFSE